MNFRKEAPQEEGASLPPKVFGSTTFCFLVTPTQALQQRHPVFADGSLFTTRGGTQESTWPLLLHDPPTSGKTTGRKTMVYSIQNTYKLRLLGDSRSFTWDAEWFIEGEYVLFY
jgi:hypothetical protein